MNTAKPSESTIRRRAGKAGFFVRKSRTRNVSAYDHGAYMLLDSFAGYPVIGEFFNVTLADIAEFLAEPQ